MTPTELSNQHQHTRREFLGRSAFLALLCAGRMRASADTDALSRRKFKICLAPGLLGIRLKMRDAIRLAPLYGFEAVEPETGELAAMSAEQMPQLLDELKQKNLAWGAAGISTPFAQPDANYKAFLEKLPASAAVLQKAGVTRVQTWITPGDNHLDYQANFRRHVQRATDIASVYADHGVRFGIEFVGPKTSRDRLKYPFIHTLREVRDLVAQVNRPNVGLVLDSWHWYTSGATAQEVKALTNHDIVSVHLNDAPAGIPVDKQIDGHRALPASTGVEDIGAFLGALIDTGYDGPAAAEPFDSTLRRMPVEEAVKQTSEAIRKALARV